MLYRRKILLALIEVLGGSLAPVDCQNLLMLFCLCRGKDYYDFFPHCSDPYSFLLYQDKTRLINLGLLARQDAFTTSEQELFFPQIHKEDQLVLRALAEEVGGKHDIQLEYNVYCGYPSTASSILPRSKYAQVRHKRNNHTTPYLFTLGYEGLSIDAYIRILLANNVSSLIDVRKNPLSMKYGFSKTKLRECLGNVNIEYFHIPDLGVPSELRKELNNTSAYESLFDYYRLRILSEQKEAIEQVKVITNTHRRTVLTCFESHSHYCHRREITDYLEKDAFFTLPVIHLVKTWTCSTSSVYTTDANVLHALPEYVNA